MTNWYQSQSVLDSAISNQPSSAMDSAETEFYEGLDKINAMLMDLRRSMSEFQQETRESFDDMKKILDRQSETFSEAIEAMSKISTAYESNDWRSETEIFPIEGDNIQILPDSRRNFDQQFEVLSDCVLGNSKVQSADDEQENLAPNLAKRSRDEFMKLEQTGELDDYNKNFEDLCARMLIYNPILPEEYFVSRYINGLIAEIRPLVKIGRPNKLADAMTLSRLHYEAVREWIGALDEELDWASVQEIGDKNQDIQAPLDSEADSTKGSAEFPSESVIVEESQSAWVEESADHNPQIIKESLSKSSKVIFYSLKEGDVQVPSKELIEFVKLLIEWMEIRLVNSRNHSMSGFWLNSIDGFLSAHRLFDELTEEKILWFKSIPGQFGNFGDNASPKKCVELRCQKVSLGTLIFDPGGILVEPDIVGQSLLLLNRDFDFRFIDDGEHSLPFDRGPVANSVKRVDANSVQTRGILLGIMIFDPGGILQQLAEFLHECAVISCYLLPKVVRSSSKGITVVIEFFCMAVQRKSYKFLLISLQIVSNLEASPSFRFVLI